MPTLMKSLPSDLREPSWLVATRRAAFETAVALPKPPAKIALGIALRADALDLGAVDVEGLGQALPLHLPTVAGADILPLAGALDLPDVQALLFSTLPKADRALAFHQALWNRGVFVRIHANEQIQEPIRLPLQADRDAIDHILILAEAQSTAKVILEARGSAPLRSEAVEIFVQEGARLSVACLQSLSAQSLQASAKFAKVGRDASLTLLDAQLGCSRARSAADVTLTEPGSSVENLGLFFGTDEQVFDLRAASRHQSGHTQSNILIKGALNQRARTVFRGLVKIGKLARASDGHQHASALLLSEDAEMDAIPNLEIENDDVKCGHGAAVGSLDPDTLFYLESRGVPEGEARRAVVLGFFESFLERLPQALADELRAALEARL